MKKSLSKIANVATAREVALSGIRAIGGAIKGNKSFKGRGEELGFPLMLLTDGVKRLAGNKK